MFQKLIKCTKMTLAEQVWWPDSDTIKEIGKFVAWMVVIVGLALFTVFTAMAVAGGSVAIFLLAVAVIIVLEYRIAIFCIDFYFNCKRLDNE